MNNEKVTRREISFPTYKTLFFSFFFSLFGPLLLSNLITFLFLIHLKLFKCYRSTTWSFTNHLWILIATKQHRRSFASVWELVIVAFGGFFFFFEFLTPSTLKVHNFLNFISFFTIFSALNVLIRGFQDLLRHQKQWSPPLGSDLPWMFKCYNCNSICN
jgi:hypothetical protein